MFKEKNKVVTGHYVANFRKQVEFYDDDGNFSHVKVEDFDPTKESCLNTSLASDGSFEAQVLAGQPLRRVKSDLLGVDTASVDAYCATLKDDEK